SGFGTSTSGTRRRAALSNLVAHGVLARLEGAHEPLGLFLEYFAALVQPVPRTVLRFGGHRLSPARELVAMLQQLIADLASRLRRERHRRGDPDQTAEEEPAEIPCCVVPVIRHDDLLAPSRTGPRRRRNPF